MIVPSVERNETSRAWGSRYVRLVLDRCQGNKRGACRVLGISYHTLQAYLRHPIDEAPAVAGEEWTDGGNRNPGDVGGDDGAACANTVEV